MSTPKVLIPHVALPFRITAAGVDVNEQDSLDDVVDCVEAIVRCPLGFRIELPDFGVPDQVFVERAIHLTDFQDAFVLWETRAETLLTERVDEFDALLHRLNIRVSTLGVGVVA